MKSELEAQDIELIAQRVADLLRKSFPVATKEGDEPFFTVETLATHLQVDPGWIYKQVALQNLPYFKSGKYLRFRKKDIDRWVESQIRRPIPTLKFSKN